MSRLRPTRTGLLLALVVLLLGTVPVLVPLLVTSATGQETSQAVRPGELPSLPVGGADTTRAPAGAPPAAGALAPTTASPTPSPTTPSPTPSPTPTPAPATSTGPPSPMPAPGPTGMPRPTPTASPTVLAAAPDLVVVSVSWQPERPVAGEPVTFVAVVRNVGTDRTPERTHGVGFTVDGEPVAWSGSSREPLAPGAERTYTADGGPAGGTWPATAGEHTVRAGVDDVDRIGESDERNNVRTARLEVEEPA